MVETGLFQDALNLCTLCHQPAVQLKDIDIGRIHEKFAFSIFQKGDFDEAINNYIISKTHPVQVLNLFPDFVPLSLQTMDRSRVKGNEKTMKLIGNVLHRAASAVVKFCEFHRAHVRKKYFVYRFFLNVYHIYIMYHI